MLRIFLKNWVFLFIIIIFDLIIGLKTSLEFFFFFFWFLLCLICLSLLWLITQYLGVNLYLSRQVNAEAVEDDILEIEAGIKNRWLFPVFNLVIEDNLSCAISEERSKRILLEYLGPGSFHGLRYNCLCAQRGKYRIGPFVVYFFEPFSLFFFRKTYHIYSDLYVYPRTFNIQKFPLPAKGILPWFGIGTVRASGDEDEFFGVREYKEGDPIKKIHWISTARKNKLIVKEFQLQSFFRATMVFNLEKEKNFGAGKDSVAEYIIKIVASLSKYLIEKGVSLEIIAHAGEIVHLPFNKGPEHLEDILRFLAIVQAESRVSLGEIIQEFSSHIAHNSSLIVVMTEEDYIHMPLILSLENKKVSVLPLIIITSTFLYPFDSQRITKEVKLKFAKLFHFNPKFFSCGDKIEETFVK